MNEVTKKFRSLKGISVKTVIYDSQYTKIHDSKIKALKKLYKHSEFEEFLSDFIHCLKIAFTHEEASPLVENTLDFASKFAVSLSHDVGEDEICPFLDGILQFLFENHECQDQNVRFRVCHFLNRLFDNMGRDAFLDEEVYEKIRSCMMKRLQDKMAKVRAEAVYALHRLQDPSDPSCRITSVFLYHMKCDPSHEVRCAIVKNIAVNKRTLPYVLKRIHDIKDVVRRAAYMVVSKLTVQRFSIRQRQTILQSGLNDMFALVRNWIVERMLPAWLDAYNSNYIEFLQSINVESFTDTSIKVLKALFTKQHIVPLASMGIEEKLIPYSKLSSERVCFWRALAEYLKPTDDSSEEDLKQFNNVLPDLTPFTQYIHQYFFASKKAERENAPTEFILVQLLHMTELYDFSDEVGRLSLKNLCMDLMLSSRVGPAITGVIAKILSNIVPDQNARLSFMAEIVTELREPLSPMNATFVDECETFKSQIAALEFELFQLKNSACDEEDEIEHLAEINKTKLQIKELECERDKLETLLENHDEDGRTSKSDTATLVKCLTLITNIIEAEDITEMNPILYSLLQNFILPLLECEVNNDQMVNQLALQALGIFCLLDLELAKEKFLMLCFQIANESLCETSLKAVFDLLHFYGLQMFNIEEPIGEFTENEILNGTARQRTNLICLLISLLKSQIPAMRITTLEGICKLIYAKRISNPYILTRLFVIWFDPDLEEEAQVKQSLTVFFNMYATNSPFAPSVILGCFIHTLKTFSRGGFREVAGKVDVIDVAKVMINLTRPNINKYDSKKNTHNLIAMNICKEIFNGNDELDICLMLKILSQLELNFKFQEEIESVVTDVTKIKKILEKSKDKTNLRLISKIELVISAHQLEANTSLSSLENTAKNETVISAANTTDNPSSSGFKLISEREVDVSLESEEISEFESEEFRPIGNFCDEIVIPETSESESETVESNN